MNDLQSRLEALFLEELHDSVQALTEGVAALEDVAGDGADPDLVQQLFRAAHSLKGAAHSAGVASAVQPCHRLEELLADVREGDRPVDDALIISLLEDIDVLVTVEQTLRTAAGGGSRSAAAPPGGAEGHAPSSTPSLLASSSEGRARVAVGRLDQLVHRAGALMSATEHVGALATDITTAGDEAAAARRHDPDHMARGEQIAIDALSRLSTRASTVDRQLRRLVAEVADTAQQLRLQPFVDVATGFDRSVRELCRATHTEAHLVITGGDVELDRDIGDAIREPLLHLLRNAVGHGIEPPEARAAAGKPARGTLRVSATAEAARVVITVTDDGAGIDLAGVREAARRQGIRISDDDDELIFLPGVSTAESVTAVSGRGIGLDAVRARIESLGGTVHLRSQPGLGTEVEIHVPRTLAVLGVVVVQAGGDQVIALPSTSLGRLHRLDHGEVEQLEGRLAVRIAGERIPAVSLAGALGIGATAPHGIAIEVAGEDGVLVVDGVQTGLDVILQPLPSRVRGAGGILGAALLPSGRAALVVNPAAALRAGLSKSTPPMVPPPTPRRPTVLLAEDTLTTRALVRSILQGAGYDVIVAADGAEAWDLLDERSVDLVVSDVDMPRMDGIQLCRAMRSTGHLAAIPVVLVTALGSDQDRQRGVDAGANAYIVKSAFEARLLLDTIRRLV